MEAAKPFKDASGRIQYEGFAKYVLFVISAFYVECQV